MAFIEEQRSAVCSREGKHGMPSKINLVEHGSTESSKPVRFSLPLS